MKRRLEVFFIVLLFLAYVQDSYAYIDPGSGSALIQGLIGLVVAAAVTLKLYWHRILRVLKIKKTPESTKKDS